LLLSLPVVAAGAPAEALLDVEFLWKTTYEEDVGW